MPRIRAALAGFALACCVASAQVSAAPYRPDAAGYPDATAVMPDGRVARLLPPRPNPFAQRTEIAWQLARPEDVVLRVLDVQGRLVRTLVNGHREAGMHRVTFEAGGLPNGLYVCQLRAGGRLESRPLVRVR